MGKEDCLHSLKYMSRTESMRFSRVRYSSQHPPVTCLEEDCSISMSREGCQLLISGGTRPELTKLGLRAGENISFLVSCGATITLPSEIFLSCFLDAEAVGMISHTKAKSGGPGRSRWMILSPSLVWRGLTSGLLITKM